MIKRPHAAAGAASLTMAELKLRRSKSSATQPLEIHNRLHTSTQQNSSQLSGNYKENPTLTDNVATTLCQKIIKFFLVS